MADYAIGLSFHKAHRTLVRAVDLTPPCRYFATRDTAGLITLPTLDAGSAYVELQGITNTTFAINDNNQEFRLLGDDGWMDSVITGSSVQASVTAYFLKNAEIPAGQNCPSSAVLRRRLRPHRKSPLQQGLRDLHRVSEGARPGLWRIRQLHVRLHRLQRRDDELQRKPHSRRSH
jgi:hypothetical protein